MNALFKPEGIGRLTLLGKCLFVLTLLIFGHVGLAIGTDIPVSKYITAIGYYVQLLASSFIVYLLIMIMVYGFKRHKRKYRPIEFRSKRWRIRILYYVLWPCVASVLLAAIFYAATNHRNVFKSEWFVNQGYMVPGLCVIVALVLEKIVPDYTKKNIEDELNDDATVDDSVTPYFRTTKNMLYEADNGKTLVTEIGGKHFIKNMSLTEAIADLPKQLYCELSRACTIHKDNIVCAYYSDNGKIYIVPKWGQTCIELPNINKAHFKAWAKDISLDVQHEKPKDL